MHVHNGLTTWNVWLGRIGLVWRWNMSVREALHTYAMRRVGTGRGYAVVGPLIVEWCQSSRGASNFRKPEHWN